MSISKQIKELEKKLKKLRKQQKKRVSVLRKEKESKTYYEQTNQRKTKEKQFSALSARKKPHQLEKKKQQEKARKQKEKLRLEKLKKKLEDRAEKRIQKAKELAQRKQQRLEQRQKLKQEKQNKLLQAKKEKREARKKAREELLKKRLEEKLRLKAERKQKRLEESKKKLEARRQRQKEKRRSKREVIKAKQLEEIQSLLKFSLSEIRKQARNALDEKQKNKLIQKEQKVRNIYSMVKDALKQGLFGYSFKKAHRDLFKFHGIKSLEGFVKKHNGLFNQIVFNRKTGEKRVIQLTINELVNLIIKKSIKTQKYLFEQIKNSNVFTLSKSKEALEFKEIIKQQPQKLSEFKQGYFIDNSIKGIQITYVSNTEAIQYVTLSDTIIKAQLKSWATLTKIKELKQKIFSYRFTDNSVRNEISRQVIQMFTLAAQKYPEKKPLLKKVRDMVGYKIVYDNHTETVFS